MSAIFITETYFGERIFNLNTIGDITKKGKTDFRVGNGWKEFPTIILNNKTHVPYNTPEKRDSEFQKLKTLILFQKGGKTMAESIKDYFKKNQETFITLAIIMLVDQFIFEGKFRDKIKDILDRLISKTETKLLNEEVSSGE